MKDLDQQNVININDYNEYDVEVNRDLANHPEGYELSIFAKILEGLDNVKNNFPGFEDEIYCMAARGHEFLYYKSALSGVYDESGHAQKVAVYDDEKKRMAELTVDMSILFDKLLKQYPDTNSIQNKIIKVFDNQLKIYRDKDYFKDYGRNYAFHANLGYAFTLLTDAHSVSDEEFDIKGYEEYMKEYPIIDSIVASQDFYMNVYKPYMEKKDKGTLKAEEVSSFREQYKQYIENQLDYFNLIKEQHENKYSKYYDFTTHNSDFFRTDWIIKDLTDELDFLNMGWAVEDISILLQVKRIHKNGMNVADDEINDFYNELLHKPVADEEVRKKVLEDVKSYVKKHNERSKESDYRIYNEKEENDRKKDVYGTYLKKIKSAHAKLQKKADDISKNIQVITDSLKKNMDDIALLQQQSLSEKDPKKQDEIKKQIEKARKKEGVLHKQRKAELEGNLIKYGEEKEKLDDDLKNYTAMNKMDGLSSKEKKQIEDKIKKLQTLLYVNESKTENDKTLLDSLIKNPKTVEEEFNELAVWQKEQGEKLDIINAKVERKANAIKILEDNEKKAVTGNADKEVKLLDVFGKNFDIVVDREVIDGEMGSVDKTTVDKHAKEIEKNNKSRTEYLEMIAKYNNSKKANDKEQVSENKDNANDKKKSNGKKQVSANKDKTNGKKQVSENNNNADENDQVSENDKTEPENEYLVNMESDFKEFAAFQLTNINRVDHFVKSSKEFASIKKCLIAMNKKMFKTWKNEEFSATIKAVDFIEMSDELRTCIMEYLDKKEKQMMADSERKDSWRKKFHEQPRIKAVINLLENLDAMTECAETALTSDTAAWKEYVSRKKGTIQANAKDRLEALDKQIRDICSKPNTTVQDENEVRELIYKVIANDHITRESFYNQMKTESEEAYRSRISSSLDGAYVDILKNQIKKNENMTDMVDDLAIKLVFVSELQNEGNAVNTIIDAYKKRTNEVTKAKNKLVSTRRQAAKTKESANKAKNPKA